MYFDSEFTFDGFETELMDLTVRKTKKFDRMWKVGFGGSICSRPLIHNDIIYFGCSDHNVYAISLEGKEIWRFRTYGTEIINRPPIIHKGKLYFGCGDGNVYCISKNGKEIWHFKTDGHVHTGVVAKGENIYFGSWDCHLYCVNAETGEEIWRFVTSTTVKSYIPPAYECFETELKIPTPKEEIKEEKAYKLFFGSELFGFYKSESPYRMKSQYKTKSEYK